MPVKHGQGCNEKDGGNGTDHQRVRSGIELRPQKNPGVPLRKLNWNGLKGTGSVKIGSVLFIYADNESKSVLARDLGDCRDDYENFSQRVSYAFKAGNPEIIFFILLTFLVFFFKLILYDNIRQKIECRGRAYEYSKKSAVSLGQPVSDRGKPGDHFKRSL